MIGVLLVDDAGGVRKGMRRYLETTTDDIQVVGEATNGVEAVRMARHLRPDVVLMDMRMPGGDGLDAVEALSGIGVKDPIAVLVYSTFHLDEYVYGALERGAVGFLLKKNPGDVPAAIRAAVNAKALNSPAIRNRLIADYARGSHRARGRDSAPTSSIDDASASPVDARLPELLTGRELEIATGLADGLTTKQIGARLDLAENSVKWHIRNMLAKTGTRDRTQLAFWLAERGMRS